MNDEEIFKILNFLSESDEKHANYDVEVTKCEDLLKQAKAHAFLKASGTVAEREALAINSVDYHNAFLDHIDALKCFKLLNNQRKTEIYKLEVWRTLSSNRRKGNV